MTGSVVIETWLYSDHHSTVTKATALSAFGWVGLLDYTITSETGLLTINQDKIIRITFV